MKKVGLVFQETARGLQGVWHWSFLVSDPALHWSSLVPVSPETSPDSSQIFQRQKNTRNAVLLIFVLIFVKLLSTKSGQNFKNFVFLQFS